MQAEEFMGQLKEIRSRILLLPEEETTADVFEEEHQRLNGLLGQLPQLTQDDQQEIKVWMSSFAQELSQKLDSLKDKMIEIQGETNEKNQRLKGIKAYGERKIF